MVVGDLMLDVVLTPSQPLELGTDVPGRVAFRQGGSAATTARWLARLGVPTTFICAVGRDAAGRALIERVAAEHVRVRAIRVSGARTGRIGVVVAPDGERSFVADRGAADRLTPDDLRASWFERCRGAPSPGVFAPDEAPGRRRRRSAARYARASGARVSVDLASVGPLLARGRRGARSVLGSRAGSRVRDRGRGRGARRPTRGALVELAPIAVVKRGPRGATVLAREGESVLRFEVATKPLPATDSTGAGDAFDAGFLAGWLEAERRGAALPAALQRAALAGHRAAARQLSSPAVGARPGMSDTSDVLTLIDIAPEVMDALSSRQAVVALESTLISHGLPYPQNVAVARASEAAVRLAGAVPATVAIAGGRVQVGLDDDALERLATAPPGTVLKAARPSLGAALASGGLAATTVSATMIAAHAAGIGVFATGGIGGVHRGAVGGPRPSLDISSDLEELSDAGRRGVRGAEGDPRCAADTLEYLETRGVPVVAVGTDELPGFYARGSGIPAPLAVPDVAAAARLIAAHRALGLDQRGPGLHAGPGGGCAPR